MCFPCVQIPKFIVTQVRQQNAANQRKQNKERVVRKLLKKITTEKTSDKPLQEVRGLNGSIAHLFSASITIRKPVKFLHAGVTLYIY